MKVTYNAESNLPSKGESKTPYMKEDGKEAEQAERIIIVMGSNYKYLTYYTDVLISLDTLSFGTKLNL